MSFLHSQSCECVSSELELFALPPTQTSIEYGQWNHYKPLSSLTDDGPIEFVVPGHGDEYIDLSHTMLNMTVQILKSDGTVLTENDNVAPVNYFLHALFSQVDVFLNQKLVSPPGNTYAYRAMVETLVHYGPAAKLSHLQTALWFKDTAGHMDSMSAANKGYMDRSALAANSSAFDMMGHLHGDVFGQERFVPNGVEVRIKLVRSRDSFSLMTDLPGGAKVHILDATLLMRQAKLSPKILIAHAKALAMSSFKYPVTSVDVHVQTIAKGVQGTTLNNVFLGQQPKRCIIGFVSNKSFNGDFAKNPFDFQHFGLNFLSLYRAGQQVPSKPLQPNFEKNLYILAYQALFAGTGIHFLNEGNSISRHEYPRGYCLFAFDLTPDLSANSTIHWTLQQQGSLSIELRFDKALTETVNCIVFAEMDNLIEIDKSRNVIVDFSN